MSNVEYTAPVPPPTGQQAVTSSRYIGGFPGDTTVPGPTDWGPTFQTGWPSPTRSDMPTLDQLRADGLGGYQVGDEWLPAHEDPSSILELQRNLFQAGLLDGDDDIQPGYFDDNTRKAFERLLEHSNGRRMDWLSTLEVLRDNPLPPGSDPNQTQPFVGQVSNPADIMQHLRDTLTQATGSGAISPEDLNALVAEFQGQQITSQRQQYDAYTSGQGGTVTAAQSIESFADEKAKAKNPVGYRAHEYLDKFSAISDMLGGASAVNS